MKLKKQILEKDPTVISTFEDQLRWNKGMNNIDCFQAINRLLSALVKRLRSHPLSGRLPGIELSTPRFQVSGQV